MENAQTLLLEEDGTTVVGLINWVSSSLDPRELPEEAALLLFNVLSRLMLALCDVYPAGMQLLVEHFIAQGVVGADDSDAQLISLDDEGEIIVVEAPSAVKKGHGSGNGRNGGGNGSSGPD